MRYLSICSGIEAASVAWHPLGWQCAGVAEIDAFPSQVLAQRLGAGRPRYMPDPEAEGLEAKDRKARSTAIKAINSRHMRWGNEIINFGDFTQIREDDVGPVDVFVGGTPCQSFSIAGKRLGLDDPRGNLTLEFLALAKRVRPRWLVWENVPGVLSHDDGRTFGTFLGLLAECGFERWAYRVLDAQYVRVGRFGRAIPQRRRRVFVVGYSGTGHIHPRAVLFDQGSLRGNPAPRREAGQVAPTIPSRRTAGGGLGTDFDCDGGLISSSGSVPHCLNAGGMGRQDYETETMIAHALRDEGFDASEDGTGRGTPLVPVAPTLRAGGNSTGGDRPYGMDVDTCDSLVPIAYRTTGNDGCYETGDHVSALTTATDPNSHILAFSAKDHGSDAMENCSPTLRAGGHTGSHANAGVMPAIAIQERAVSENASAGPDGKGWRDDGAAYTLEARAIPQAVSTNWRVRRLTPKECERLQAFDDNWTRIEWRGKPADQCPDGPRYKACGNSMAVNCMTWLGERIQAVENIIQEGQNAA